MVNQRRTRRGVATRERGGTVPADGFGNSELATRVRTALGSRGVTAPTAITPADLSRDVSPYNIPEPVNETVARNGLTASVSPNPIEATAVATTPVTPLQKNTERVDKILTDLGLKPDRTLEIQKEYDVSKKRDAAKKIENEALGIQRQYKDLVKRAESNPEGKLLGGVQAEVRRLETERDSRLADKAITYKIANDDYNGAFEDAKTAIAAEFEPLENELKTRLQLFGILKDDLTEKEAIDYKAKLDGDKDTLDAFKAAKTSYSDIAVQSGNTQAVLDIKNAKDEDEVRTIASKYGLKSIDDRYKEAQLYKLNAEAAQLTGTSGRASEDLAAYANDYAVTGVLPSPADLKISGLTAGQITEFAMQAPKQEGSLVSSVI